jgi:hypothetical protein
MKLTPAEEKVWIAVQTRIGFLPLAPMAYAQQRILF